MRSTTEIKGELPVIDNKYMQTSFCQLVNPLTVSPLRRSRNEKQWLTINTDQYKQNYHRLNHLKIEQMQDYKKAFKEARRIENASAA